MHIVSHIECCTLYQMNKIGKPDLLGRFTWKQSQWSWQIRYPAMLHEQCWSEHSQSQVHFSRNINSSLPAPLTGSEERCSALKGPAAAGLDQKFWCKQNWHRVHLWFFSVMHYSIAWFSPRSCIQVWLSSLDGHIPKLILKVFHVVWQCFCLQVGLHAYSVMHAWVNCPKYAWTYPKLAPSFNKRAFRGVPLGQSATSCPAFWPPAVGSHWKQLHCWSHLQHDRIDCCI